NAQGVESMVWNPAGLTSGSRHEVFADYMSLYEDMNAATVGYSCQMPWISLGALISYFGYGAIERFDLDAYNNPIRTNQSIEPFSLIAELGAAKSLSPALSLGVNTKFMQEDLVDKKFYFLAWDVGLQIITGLEGLRVGAAVKNLGWKKFAEFPLPMLTQIGAAYKIPLGFFQPDELCLMLDGMLPQDQPLKGALGLEYTMHKIVSIRVGYQTSDARLAENFLTGFSFGMGIKFREYSLDYAYSPNTLIGDGHRITLMARFGPRGEIKRKGRETKKQKGKYLYEYLK
ncbi:PorV/PorQ family protein, partial [bacterium]|nr:PorV/PorQ family protein [bacterium]